MKKFVIPVLLLATAITYAQITPEIYSWKQNLDGTTGYNGIPADVQQVFYSANYVYVKSTGIPSYTIGPWTMNPNTPSNQNWTFKITRFPVIDLTPSTAGNGQIGVLINGVVVFNAGDAMSYNNQNIWHRIAQYFESVSFDTSGGHPAPGGVYHYHINMKKLYSPNPNQHSPILGYMFDGFPLYGPYGYSNPNGTGGIRRMKSGYKKRNITTRTTLPNGTVLQPAQYGPPVSSQYPLGCFVEDYELASSGTDLDSHNGRICVTPDYPNQTYAYFIAVDSTGTPEYPYIIGPTYYGEVVPGNTPPGGHVTISESVTQYSPRQVSLTAIIEGFYDANTNSMTSDTARIYLHSVASPYAVVDSSKALLNSSGIGNFIFLNSSNGVPYYLHLKHRNSLETWSSSGNAFVNSAMIYDFTSSASAAYGNNLKPVDSAPVKYGIFSGDINNEGVVDLSDIIGIYNDAQIFSSGYLNTDLTGDNYTDVTDIIVAYNNAIDNVITIKP